MLYTILNLDDVLATPEQGIPTETRIVENRILEGSRTNEGFVVNRVISTNPFDFLDKRFSPGTRI